MLAALVIAAASVSAQDLREVRIQKFLNRYPDSPLHGHAKEILYCADYFGLDYRLYLAIAGAESGFGRKHPAKTSNFTGICNGGTRFDSVYHNIYYTHKLIATTKWYKKYRQTKDIKDLIYVYKAVPPYDHYIRNMRFTLDMISAMDISKEKEDMLTAKASTIREKAQSNILLAWNTTRYDLCDSEQGYVAEFDFDNDYLTHKYASLLSWPEIDLSNKAAD